ncbi:hypothetical protein JT05_05060 [Desulfosporosinus sp. Tol-M]|jgi:hypothetical protein|nr:hypothetical protein JT05_05060 [Desulfosporosinus sp. Tol-M]
MSKEALITKIIDLEWNMFHNVSNIGGKASCQDNPETFKIMRHSQAVSWSEDTLESYLNDLSKAQEIKRNLLTEKYARMMQYTSPLEYAKIEHRLPSLDPEIIPLIDKIVKIVMEWEEELSVKFPNILKRGRPISSTNDSMFVTSVETYLRGELMTYSQRTLELYYQNVLKQQSERINGSEITLLYMVKQYGFNTLAEANEKLEPKF